MARYQVAERHEYGVVLDNGDVAWHVHPAVIELPGDTQNLDLDLEAGNLVRLEDEQ